MPPDGHDQQPLGPLTLGYVGLPEHDNGVALLDELVRAHLELVPRPNRLLEDLDRRLLPLRAESRETRLSSGGGVSGAQVETLARRARWRSAALPQRGCREQTGGGQVIALGPSGRPNPRG
jgi:hypothetical protein